MWLFVKKKKRRRRRRRIEQIRNDYFFEYERINVYQQLKQSVNQSISVKPSAVFSCKFLSTTDLNYFFSCKIISKILSTETR